MFNFEEQEVAPQQNVDDTINESIVDVEVDEVESDTTIADRLPDVKRAEIKSEDIFDLDANLAVMPDDVKEDIDQDYMEQGTTMDREHEHQRAVIESAKTPKPRAKKVTLNKDGRPRKPMSESHKAKLAESRKKAAEGRRLAKIRRDEEREFKKQEAELLKKKKQKDFEKLKAEVNEEPKAPAPAPAPIQRGLTQEDLRQAQYEAILAYDKLRKEQKAEKKRLQAEEKAKQELMAKIMPQQTGYRAKGPNGKYLNPWDSCY
jgi:hypothetical protein